MSKFLKIFIAACATDPRARLCLLGAVVLIGGSLVAMSIQRIETPTPKACPEIASAGDVGAACIKH